MSACIFRAGQTSRGTRPLATVCKAGSFHRRARACPSPCSGHASAHPICRAGSPDPASSGSGEPELQSLGARERARGTGPRATVKKACRFTVGRGPVPRHAAGGRETAFVGVRFSRRSNERGGQAPALRYARPAPFTVGRGPVPRHAIGYTNDRGGQAPALRARKSSSLCARSGSGEPELQSPASNPVKSCKSCKSCSSLG